MNTEHLGEFFSVVLRNSVFASVLVGLVLGVRRLLGVNLAAQWRCALWLLVMVRLVWPFSLPSPVSIFNLIELGRLLPAADPGPAGPAGGLAGGLAGGFHWLVHRPAVGWLWAGGMALLGLRLLAGTLHLLWRLRGSRPVVSWETWWLLRECCTTTGVTTPVRLLESPRLTTPCLLGVLRPRIVLPAGLRAGLSAEELRLVFLHELAHLRRRDTALNWFLAAIETLHWFNPLVRLAADRLRADREEACDAAALDARPGSNRTYGGILLKLLAGPGPAWPEASPAVAALSGTVGAGTGADGLPPAPLLARIRAIARFRPGTRTWIVGFCTWLALACVGLTDAQHTDPAGDTRAATESPVR